MRQARPDAGRRAPARPVRRAVVPLCALTLLPAACGAPSGPAHASGPATSGRPPAAGGPTHHPAPTSPAPPTVCGEPEPDAGPVDLVSVLLDRSPAGTVVTFDLRGPAVTSFDVLTLSVGLWGADGAAERSLGARWVHGEASLLVYDVQEGSETELSGRPSVSGGRVTLRFPASATAGMGPTTRWEAYASVNGTQVDECPSP